MLVCAYLKLMLIVGEEKKNDVESDSRENDDKEEKDYSEATCKVSGAKNGI